MPSAEPCRWFTCWALGGSFLGASVTVAHSYVIPVYAFPDGAIISSPELAAQLSDAAQKNLDAAVNTRKECGVELASVLTNG